MPIRPGRTGQQTKFTIGSGSKFPVKRILLGIFGSHTHKENAMRTPKTLDREKVLEVLHQLQNDVSAMRQVAFDAAMASLKSEPLNVAKATGLFGTKNGIADVSAILNEVVLRIEYLDIS